MSSILIIAVIWLSLAVAMSVAVGHVIRHADSRGTQGGQASPQHGLIGAPVGSQEGNRRRRPLTAGGASCVGAAEGAPSRRGSGVG